MRISVLDIGATTINLLRATVGPGGLVKWGDYQCFVRLGEGTLLSGLISKEAWGSAVSGIASLRASADARKPDLLVSVATSAIREAINGAAFAETLRRDHQLELRVLSPSEEAALAHRGALSATSAVVGAGPFTVVDVGGGCVSFALGEGPRCDFTASLPLGPLRLLPAFAPNAVLSPFDVPALAALVRRSVAPTALALDERGPTRLCFCSGAARAAREYAMRASDAPGLVGSLTHAALLGAQRDAAGASVSELVACGVRSEQADTMGIAVTLMATIMEVLAVEEAVVVDRGLREGVALTEYERASITIPQRPSALLHAK